MGQLLGFIALIAIICVLAVQIEPFGGALRFPQLQGVFDGSHHFHEDDEYWYLEQYFNEIFCEIFNKKENFYLAYNLEQIYIVAKNNIRMTVDHHTENLLFAFSALFNRKQIIGIGNMANYGGISHGGDFDERIEWEEVGEHKFDGIYYFTYGNMTRDAQNLLEKLLTKKNANLMIIYDELLFLALRNLPGGERIFNGEPSADGLSYQLNSSELEARDQLYQKNKETLEIERLRKQTYLIRQYLHVIYTIEDYLKDNTTDNDLIDYIQDLYLRQDFFRELRVRNKNENESKNKNEPKSDNGSEYEYGQKEADSLSPSQLIEQENFVKELENNNIDFDQDESNYNNEEI